MLAGGRTVFGESAASTMTDAAFAKYREAEHRRPELARALEQALSPERVLSSPVELFAYEYDASLERGRPDVVVFPETEEEVAAVYAIARRRGVPVIPRGSGTNLSGGTVAPGGGIVLQMSRFRRIIEVDPASRRAAAQCAVYNFDLNEAVARYNLFFAPDPSSWKVATLGGNVAENSGGPRAFKYGVTSPHITGLTLVTPTGDIVKLGGKTIHGAGYDLVGLIVGSEGTLGTVTEVVARLLRTPEAVHTILAAFDDVEQASEAVSAIVASGIVPAAMEMMDRTVIRAVEAAARCGYPTDAEAVLVIDLDGLREEIAESRRRVRELLVAHGATEVREAADEEAREALWLGRRYAFAALAELANTQIVCDGTVPRDRLPEAVREIERLCARYGVLMANGFHAGDGNLHPKLLVDGETPGARRTIEELSAAILEICVALGGTITGEHGVGLEKVRALPLVIDAPTLDVMCRIRRVFDPAQVANPGKIFSCAPRERPRPLSPPEDLVEALVEVVGPESVIAEQARLRACAVDGFAPRAIVRPGDPQAVAQVLRVCYAAGAAVLPWGCGAQRDAGPPVDRLDVLLDLSRLSRIVEHRPANLTATVQAGARLAVVREALAPARQDLPTDAPGEITVGGLLATRAGAGARLAFGPIRDHVLGMAVALATGEVIRCGGQVVKNVAGYDLAKLFVGSWGTLGVVVEATIKLVPQPAAQGSVHATFGDLAQAFAAASAVVASPLKPHVVEVFLPGSGQEGEIVLACQFAGAQGALQRQLRDCSRLLADHGARRVLPGACAPEQRECKREGLVVELLVPAGQSEWAASAVVEALERRGVAGSVACSPGIGALTVAVSPAQHVPALVDDLAATAEELGGHARALRGPAELRRALYEAQPEPGGWDWMCRIKQELDPRGILAPGKLLGRM